MPLHIDQGYVVIISILFCSFSWFTLIIYQQRLGRDSMCKFDACYLCLRRAWGPVCCSKVINLHIFLELFHPSKFLRTTKRAKGLVSSVIIRLVCRVSFCRSSHTNDVSTLFNTRLESQTSLHKRVNVSSIFYINHKVFFRWYAAYAIGPTRVTCIGGSLWTRNLFSKNFLIIRTNRRRQITI